MERRVRTIVKNNLPKALANDFESIVDAALDEWGFWEGSESDYYKWVGRFAGWWSRQKREELELALYETGEIYGAPGVVPSEYGTEGPYSFGV